MTTDEETDEMNAPLLLTEEQAAARLGLAPKTLRGWRHTGDGPRYVKISRRCVRYALRDLEAWIASRTIESTSQDVRDPDYPPHPLTGE